MTIHTHNIRVPYADTDQMGIVYHANYFKYFEIGRVEALRVSGTTYDDLEKIYGIMLPVYSVKARFIRPAGYDQELGIKTCLKKMTDKYMYFDNEIISKNGKLICGGEVVLYFMDAQSKNRIDCPKMLKELLT